jgi:hypothetical protein
MSKKLTKTKVPYPIEVLDEEDDDGTMPANVETLADAVVGHKIVFADQDGYDFITTERR